MKVYKDLVALVVGILAIVLAVWLLTQQPLRGQDEVPCTSVVTAWIHPEAAVDKLHGKLVFWRLHMNSAQGDWHLLNDEDQDFLKQTAIRIANGQYKDTKLEYTSVEGKLPK